MPAVQETVDQVRRIDVDQYKYGFETLIESEKAPKGLSEDTVRFISAKKNEPEWMLAWRLEAFKRWLTMREPKWAKVEYGPIDYQDIYYYSAPKEKGRTEIARRDRSGNPAHLREARHPAARAGNPAWRAEPASRGRGRGRRRSRKRQRLWPGRGRRRVRFGLGGDHVQGGTGQGRRTVHADLGSAASSIRIW